MADYPAFTVRAYPGFRPARNFRVFVLTDALYLIRMRGLVSVGDAGWPQNSCDPAWLLIARVIHWTARRNHEKTLAEIDQRGLEEMLLAHSQNVRASPYEIVGSTLSTPRLLFNRGIVCYARWTITFEGRKPTLYEIEDEQSLRTALTCLPELLGSKLTVRVSWGEQNRLIVPIG